MAIFEGQVIKSFAKQVYNSLKKLYFEHYKLKQKKQ